MDKELLKQSKEIVETAKAGKRKEAGILFLNLNNEDKENFLNHYLDLSNDREKLVFKYCVGILCRLF